MQGCSSSEVQLDSQFVKEQNLGAGFYSFSQNNNIFRKDVLYELCASRALRLIISGDIMTSNMTLKKRLEKRIEVVF